jgi:hypothetical protein
MDIQVQRVTCSESKGPCIPAKFASIWFSSLPEEEERKGLEASLMVLGKWRFRFI